MSFSVIIPFYSEIQLIGRAVDSVVSGSDGIHDLEIIIGNDGFISTDAIMNAIPIYARSLVKIVKNSGVPGPGGARNAAIDASSKKFIAFLDADDYWLPGKLSLQFHEINKGFTFIVCGYIYDTSNLVILPPDKLSNCIDIFIRLGIGTSTVLIARSLLKNFRFRDIRFAQDIDFWYRLAQSPQFNYRAIDRPLTVYSTKGSTSNKFEQLRYLIKVLELNDVPRLFQIRIIIFYILRGILNHYIRFYWHKINRKSTGHKNG